MTEPAYVAVDWGTSSFRLWLIDGAGQVLAERRSGEGMLAATKAGFPAVLRSHLAAVEAPDHLPVLVCGMAGARTGWVEAGYVDTPQGRSHGPSSQCGRASSPEAGHAPTRGGCPRPAMNARLARRAEARISASL